MKINKKYVTKVRMILFNIWIIFLLNLFLYDGVFAQQDNQIISLVKEDFLKAPEGSDVTTLYRSYSFDIDGQGNIFILDGGNYRVL